MQNTFIVSKFIIIIKKLKIYLKYIFNFIKN